MLSLETLQDPVADDAQFNPLPDDARDWLAQAHVVILMNYLRRLHVDVFEELEKQVGRLTILLSTPMEPDRQWEPTWGKLNVVVQKNWTVVRKWRHSTGFQEDNFVHLPYDTHSQLKRLCPDAVVSSELGFRTLFSSRYTRARRIPLIALANMSEAIERERGWGRRTLRQILRRRVDCFTFNGPSCHRYFTSLKIPDCKLSPFPYFYDMDKVFQGEKEFSSDLPRKLLFSGNLTSRKGVGPLADAVAQWANDHPERRLQLRVCGCGPELSTLDRAWPENLQVELLGACSGSQLADSYGWADICLFPTLADEWGLVPIEAFASGCPVVGSLAAQSLEVYGREGRNGWYYSPLEAGSLTATLDRALSTSASQLHAMSQDCRETVQGITAADCADKLAAAIWLGQKNCRSR